MRFNLRNVCHWIRPIVSGEYWGQRPAAVAQFIFGPPMRGTGSARSLAACPADNSAFSLHGYFLTIRLRRPVAERDTITADVKPFGTMFGGESWRGEYSSW